MDMDNSSGAAAGGADGGAAAAGGGSVADALIGGAATGGDAGTGAGDGGAGAGAGGGAAASADGGADPDWYAQLSGDPGEGESASLRDVAKAKGWKSLDDVVKSYREVERAFRESGRIKVPGEGASAEEVAAFHKAIGVPDDAKGYSLPEFKDAEGNAVKLNTPLLDRLADQAHKAGVPKAAYEALVGDFVQAQMEEITTENARLQGEARDWLKEQGDKAPAKTAAINRGAQALGLNAEEVLAIRGAIGSKRAMETLARLGERVGEDVLTGGEAKGGFMISGETAQAQINAMRADPIVAAKIMQPGTPENARYNRLIEVVGQAENRKRAAGG